jgi:P4 family phage/plasmid primase-like protien
VNEATATLNGHAAAIAASNGDGLALFPGFHREKLEACGLSADTIRAAGIHSVGDRAEIAAKLGRKSVPLSWGPCIAIPYLDETGATVYTRVRPNNPPVAVKTGKPQKYMQPSGVKPRLYVPPAAWSTLNDAAARLLITEGEFKALAATERGFPCVALPGVDCWCDDPQSIESLQEWFGYLLTHDTRQQKLLLLVGPKRSGKGTIARVLTALVGKGNVAAPTLGGLATNFGMWPLIGKSVGIISDARLSGRADQAAVVERLLSITGEDSITVDRKNMQPITLRLPTRFVILTNELPKLSDASGAIVSRVILLHTNRSFYGREDHDLTDKLLAELPGILLWAIEGWRRLRARGRLLQPETGLESLGEINDLASPVAAFIRERCEVNRLARVTTADLFSAWKRWCESQGREKLVGTVQSFARDLLAAESTVRRVRLRDGEDRARAYEGIALMGGF